MTKKTWTEKDTDILINLTNSGIALPYIAKQLGRTFTSCERKLERLRRSKEPGLNKQELSTRVAASNSLDEDLAIKDKTFWKRAHDQLLKKYNKLADHQSAVAQLVADVRSLAPKGYDPAPAVILTKERSVSSPQSAVLVLSDTHVGKVVSPDQTLGFGEYDFDVFLARLKYAELAVRSILEDHVTTEVHELVLPILGDMIDGALNHAAEVGQHHTLFQQFYGAGHALAQFIRNLAAIVPKIRVFTAVGNHTRWQNQRKMPTDNRYSNLDHFLYAYLQALTADIPNVYWNLDFQPFCLFEVQGFLFHGSHGDHLRGGDKALGIPNHAVGRAISATAQIFGKAGKRSPEYYLTGHLHRSISLPHATGQFVVNGGFPGVDNYGLMSNFQPVDPTQKFFMVHHKFGMTASYDLQLKFAKVYPNEQPYSIPS